jgi:hypothetical protein
VRLISLFFGAASVLASGPLAGPAGPGRPGRVCSPSGSGLPRARARWPRARAARVVLPRWDLTLFALAQRRGEPRARWLPPRWGNAGAPSHSRPLGRAVSTK